MQANLIIYKMKIILFYSSPINYFFFVDSGTRYICISKKYQNAYICHNTTG